VKQGKQPGARILVILQGRENMEGRAVGQAMGHVLSSFLPASAGVVRVEKDAKAHVKRAVAHQQRGRVCGHIPAG